MMMTMTRNPILALCMVLVFPAAFTNAFVVPATPTTHNNGEATSRTTALLLQQREQQQSSDADINRRLAMVKAAAIASGAFQLTTSSATAKSAIFSLEAKLATLEEQNMASKNSNGDPVKHTPAVTIEEVDGAKNGRVVKFTVPHVMDPEKPHYIQYMWLEDVSGKQKKPPGNIVAVKQFSATDAAPPTLVENLASGKLPTLKASIVKGMVLKPCLYCNLHGLWEGDPIETV
jgi:desulfoferrodoxin (superoxide reductase-like protein)